MLFFSLINCAYSVFSTVLKARFSDVLTSSEKSPRFSLNYSFEHRLDDRAASWHVSGDVQPAAAVLAGRVRCAALPLGFIHFFVQKALR